MNKEGHSRSNVASIVGPDPWNVSYDGLLYIVADAQKIRDKVMRRVTTWMGDYGRESRDHFADQAHNFDISRDQDTNRHHRD